MADLSVLDGRNVIDPAHIENNTGRWLCDGKTADAWANAGTAMTKEGGQMSGEAIEAFAISAALQALDNREEEL